MRRVMLQKIWLGVLILLGVGCILQAQPLSSTVGSDEFAIKEHVDILSQGILLGVSGYGACLVEFHTAGSYTLIVIAHAENPDQQAALQILVDKQPVTTLDVSSAEYSSYTFSTEISAGFHEIGFNVPNAGKEGAILLESLTILPAKGLERVTMLDMESFKRKQYDRTARPGEEAQRRIDTIRKGRLHFRVIDEEGQPVPGAIIQVVQKRHEFPFGIQVPATEHITAEEVARYAPLSDYLNAVSLPGVCLGWSKQTPKDGVFDFVPFDQIVGLFRKAGFSLRAGCLFPEKRDDVPLWADKVTDKQLSVAVRQLSRILAAHTEHMLRAVDVMSIQGGYLFNRLGPGICRQILHELHAANPELQRFVHTSCLIESGRTAAVAEQVLRQANQGLDYDGVSILSQLSGETQPYQIKDALDELTRIKKPVIIQGPVEGTEKGLSKEHILQFYRMVFSHPAISGLYAGGSERQPAAFDPLPSAQILRELIADNWWTTEKRVTNRKGTASISAFFGQYRVAVQGPEGQHVNVAVRFPSHKRNLNLVVRLPASEGSSPSTRIAKPKPAQQNKTMRKPRSPRPAPVMEDELHQPVPAQ